jgi:hypothetical protein
MPRFTIWSPQVIHETVDGEAVIVNLETGTYYMLKDTGERIWAAMVRGRSVPDILTEIGASYQGPGRQLEDTVSGFLDELVREGLIAPSDERGESPSSAGPLTSAAGNGAPFAAPVLHKFQDMKELILLDPVHQVHEDLGWADPKTAP